MSLLDVTLGGQAIAFLRRLARHDGVCSREQLRPADREEDKARQQCRRRGYVQYSGGYWRLTEAGKSALARLKPE